MSSRICATCSFVTGGCLPRLNCLMWSNIRASCCFNSIGGILFHLWQQTPFRNYINVVYHVEHILRTCPINLHVIIVEYRLIWAFFTRFDGFFEYLSHALTLYIYKQVPVKGFLQTGQIINPCSIFNLRTFIDVVFSHRPSPSQLG